MINVLIAIIINSMEEVHSAEKEADREEIVAGEGETVAERIADIREALNRLEVQLAEGGGDLPGPAKSVRKRPTKGGRMRG